MSVELLKQGLRDRYIGATILAVLLLILMFYMGYMFPLLMDLPSVQALFESPMIKALLGPDASVSSFEGFMVGEGLNFASLLIGGFLAFVTASFVAGEIEKKTMDLLLSLPLKREGLVLWRYLLLVPIVAVLLLGILAGILAGAAYNHVQLHLEWVLAGLGMIGLLALAFGAIGTLVSTVFSDGRQAAILSVGLYILMYIVENLGATVARLTPLRALSLFHYVGLKEILLDHQISTGNVAVLAGVIVFFLALAVIAFRRRDIKLV